jgi:hypothetical protein
MASGRKHVTKRNEKLPQLTPPWMMQGQVQVQVRHRAVQLRHRFNLASSQLARAKQRGVAVAGKCMQMQ